MRRLICIICLLPFVTLAQSSHYSAYGFGMQAPTSSVRMLGLGEAGSGIRDSLGVNPKNPALWNGFFTASLQGQLNTFSVASDKAQGWYTLNQFGGFSFKFPIGPYIGFVLGMAPISRTAVKQSYLDSLNFNNNYIWYQDDLEIKGGLSEFYSGLGYRVTKNLNAGLKLRFIFGDIVYRKLLDLGNNNEIDSFYKRRLTVKGTQAGVGFTWEVPDNYRIAMYMEQNVDFQYKKAIHYQYGPDSVSQYQALAYPALYRIGFYKQFWNNMAIVGDFEWRSVQKDIFQNFNIYQDGFAQNAYQVSAGLEKVSSRALKREWWQNLFFRAGGYYKTGLYYKEGFEKYSELGITTGMGIPYYNNLNRIDIALKYGLRKGFLDEIIGEERILTLHFGITTGGVWFRRFR